MGKRSAGRCRRRASSTAGRRLGADSCKVQLRGEYLYTVSDSGGFRVYDVANVANKGFSQPVLTAPVSPLGQDTHIATKHATSFDLPTTMPVAPFRKQLPENQENPLHPIYHYAAITDAEEGLILVNVDTLADGPNELGVLPQDQPIGSRRDGVRKAFAQRPALGIVPKVRRVARDAVRVLVGHYSSQMHEGNNVANVRPATANFDT